MATTYTKEPLSVEGQVELLKSRGLIIDNEAVAEAMLYSVSYFRLVAYLRPMEANKETHEFKPNSRFDDAVALYYFDCELRNLIFKAVQDIEIALPHVSSKSSLCVMVHFGFTTQHLLLMGINSWKT